MLELITTRGSKTELQLGFRFACFEALVFANCYVLLDLVLSSSWSFYVVLTFVMASGNQLWL